MRRYALLTALAVLMSLLASPALAYVINDASGASAVSGTAEEETIEEPLPEPSPTPAVIAPPAFRNERVYFHCSDPAPVANVNLVAEDAIPSWNTTPPAGSVTDANGCLTADANGVAVVVEPQENPTDGVWQGTFTGNLKSLTVELH